MKKIRVNVLALIILSLIIPLFSGCSFKKESYSYDLKNITYSKYLYLTKTVYYSDRVEFHMECDDTSNIIISDLEVTYPEVNAAHIEIKNDTITIYSNNPEQITALDVSYDWWYVGRFRYLNSDKYSCVWRECTDDGGWSDYQGDEKAFFTQAEYEEQEKRVERSFEIAKIINENSNIDYELLADGSMPYKDDPESIPLGIELFKCEYPIESGKYYWSKIYVENGPIDFLGIHIGDSASDIPQVMEEYGFEFSETSEEVISIKEADHIDVYKNGDVYFSFYLNGDEIACIYVAVNSDQPWIHEYH